MINITKEKLLTCFTNYTAIATDTQALNPKWLPAGVLVPIIHDKNELNVLFTERTTHLKHHAGQISFPGGRMEPGDRDLAATTLRETREEIGLPAKQITLLGSLEPLLSSTGFLVTPFIGLLIKIPPLKIDPFEVARVFTAPLNFVLDPVNQNKEEIIFKGKPRTIYTINYQGNKIWGLTAAILLKLTEKLRS